MVGLTRSLLAPFWIFAVLIISLCDNLTCVGQSGVGVRLSPCQVELGWHKLLESYGKSQRKDLVSILNNSQHCNQAYDRHETRFDVYRYVWPIRIPMLGKECLQLRLV